MQFLSILNRSSGYPVITTQKYPTPSLIICQSLVLGILYLKINAENNQKDLELKYLSLISKKYKRYQRL